MPYESYYFFIKLYVHEIVNWYSLSYKSVVYISERKIIFKKFIDWFKVHYYALFSNSSSLHYCQEFAGIRFNILSIRFSAYCCDNDQIELGDTTALKWIHAFLGVSS